MTGHPERDEAVLVEDETRTEEPPLYRVVLHNDDFTTMDFVVFVLRSVFHRSEEDAWNLMMQVHVKGFGVAGIYPHEVAEMKVAEVTELARANEFPLLCTMERE